MLPAALQNEDTHLATQLLAYIKTHFLRERREKGSCIAWLEEGVEWSIGNTANLLLGLSLQALGPSGLRDFIFYPLPRKYFDGALIDTIEPLNTRVYAAYRDDKTHELIITCCSPSNSSSALRRSPRKVKEDQFNLLLYLSNVTNVRQIESEAVLNIRFKFIRERGRACNTARLYISCPMDTCLTMRIKVDTQ